MRKPDWTESKRSLWTKDDDFRSRSSPTQGPFSEYFTSEAVIDNHLEAIYIHDNGDHFISDPYKEDNWIYVGAFKWDEVHRRWDYLGENQEYSITIYQKD